MTIAAPTCGLPDLARVAAPVVDVVVPIYNEERALAASVLRLRAHLDRSFPWTSVITIADNGSTDGSQAEGMRLAAELAGVRYLRLEVKGRGRALRTAWAASEAIVLAYMDVDLSTSLEALEPLVHPLLESEADIAIGSRLAPGARVVRSPKREIISRCYNTILRVFLRARFSDAQCGFKAMPADLARRLLSDVEDQSWFFDTELLVCAQRQGLRIHEVPVEWIDDPDSRVRILRTAWDDLAGIARLFLHRAPAHDRPPNLGSAPAHGRVSRWGRAPSQLPVLAAPGPTP